MSGKTSDRRKIRTKKLIYQALLELIEEKGLDGITVSDLTARADINRGTFYLHYKDVNDLIDQLQQEILSGYEELADQIDLMDVIRYAHIGEPYPGLEAVLEYWSRYADLCKALLGPKGDPSFAPRVKELMYNKIFSKVESTLPSEPNDRSAIPRSYILAYMISANIGIVQHWLETGMQHTPRELALMLTRLTGQGPIAAFGVPRQT